MFKFFKKEISSAPRQGYLNGLLQSAKWLGWDGQATPATLPNVQTAQDVKPVVEARDERLPAHSITNRKAA